ncbi:MAG: Gldg family protein [Clostridia bacterium]|nr:Gldg family protein [Clostridia bacterium]
MTPKPSEHKKMHPANAWMILSVLILSAILLLNVLVQALPSHFTIFDLTAQKISEVSDATRDYLSRLEEDVVLYRVAITGNEDKAVVQLLEHYDELSSRVRVEAVDPTVHPQFVAGYTDKQLSDNSIIISSNKRSKALDYNDLLLYNIYYSADGENFALQSQMTYSDFSTFYETYADFFTQGYYTYQTLFVGEDAITSAIDYVTSDVLPKVYLTTGHGETPFPEVLYGYLSHDNIDCAEYSSVASDFPSDADAIVIYAPTKDFSAEETKALKDYLLLGGNVILLTSYTDLELPNLRAMMKEFGMEASENLIAENDPDRRSNYKYFLLPDTAGAREHYSLSSYTLLAPYSHPISMVQGDYIFTYTPLFSTSDKASLDDAESSEEGSEELSLQATADADESQTEPNKKVGKYDVGALVTLSGESAGHLCWFGSPDILDSDYNSASGGGNYTYFLTILGDMCEKNYSLIIESKVMDGDALILSGFQIGFWGVVLIAVIPLTVLGMGVFVHLKRKYR